MSHHLEFIYRDTPIAPYEWEGLCECHNPDELGVGRADFSGDTPQEVVDLHWEHAIAMEKQHDTDVVSVIDYLNDLNASGRMDYSTYAELHDMVSSLIFEAGA